MSETARVAVIGGGPAGLAAAIKLHEGGLRVLLVETSDRLGGAPAEFGCVATDRCATCGGCLAPQLARDVEDKSDTIEVLLGTRLSAVSGGPRDRVVHVAGRSEPVAGIIVATGYRHADIASARPEYGHGRVAGVSTVRDLEDRYRSGALFDAPPETLAFIQCAGSRDRRIGRDYCSRVCCTYALRLARAIHYRAPEIALTVFYQDLTPAGPGFLDLVEECEGFVRFIRALPAKVYQEPGAERPVVCYADTLARSAPIEEPFTEVALSGGLWASEHADLDEVLGLARDEHGFLEASALNRVFLAGAACGPTTSAVAIDSGRVAAAELLRRLQPDAERGTIAILGGDELVEAIAQDRGFETLSTTEITGRAGAFLASGPRGEVPVVGAIVPGVTASADEEGGLPPKTRSLYSERAMRRAATVKLLAILPDAYAPFSRHAHELALRIAAERSGAKQRTWILLRHAFTGEMGLEQLLTRAREAGTVLTTIVEPPELGDGEIVVTDPSLGKRVRIKADLVLAAPALGWTGRQRRLLNGLGLLSDRGLVCLPNPHMTLSATEREGVHVAGWVRDPGASAVGARHAIEAALASLATPPVPAAVEVDSAKCAICLTCIRVCPHGAPTIVHDEERDKDVSFIQPEACVACGTCVTLCPADAIAHGSRSNESVLDALEALYA